MPLDETLGALDDLVRAGKVRYIGSSTAPAWHVVEAVMTSDRRGWSRSSASSRRTTCSTGGSRTRCCRRANGTGWACWRGRPWRWGCSPGGTPTVRRPRGSRVANRGGIYAERVTPAGVAVGNQFAALAREHGHDPAQLAMCFVKDQPGITAPIIGPKSVAQLEGLLPVLEMTLPPDIQQACDELVTPGSVVASFFNSAPWMRWKHL